jgi:predicted DNA-binding transcriptional regulator YafY
VSARGAERDPRADTAEAVLGRLLVSLPAAAVSGDGVLIASLAAELGVDPHRLVLDFTEVYERGFYLHAGMGDQISVGIDADRVQVRTTGHFERPVALTVPEALALELGMRMVDGGAGDAALSRRLIEALRAAAPLDDADPESEAPTAIGVAAAGDGADPLLPALQDALRRGLVCAFRYLAADRTRVATRRLLPGLLVHAEGSWYLVGRDLDREAPRVFRCDRILDLETTERPDEVSPLSEAELAGLEAFLHPDEGRVWMPPEAGGAAPEVHEARVRYDADIAPWIRERNYPSTEARPDGSLEVTHRVTDGDWVVRHVLSYGGSAELLGPPELRARVEARAADLARQAGAAVR